MESTAKSSPSNTANALLLTLLSFIVMYVWGRHLAGLIAGVILLDIVSASGSHLQSDPNLWPSS
jgi:hypothetical protein